MISNRNINIIKDVDGKCIVIINDIHKYLYDILSIKKETRNPQQ